MDERILREESRQLRAQIETLRDALKWYSGYLRPEDRLNDNGERAMEALAKAGKVCTRTTR